MNANIAKRIESADWESLYPVLIDYAELKLRHHIAMGLNNGNGRPVIDGMDANVLLDIAIDKTLEGVRAWNPDVVDLERHLKETIRSLISAFFKKGVMIIGTAKTADGLQNPIDIEYTKFDESENAIDDIFGSEEHYKLLEKHLDAFKNSIKECPELIDVFESYAAELTTPKDIADVTGYDVRSVDNLKQKLKRRYIKFTQMYIGPLLKKDLVKEK